MTAPGRNHLVRLGVRQRVASEYRRLVLAGVNPASAVILARHAPRRRLSTGGDNPGDLWTDAPRT